MFPERAIVMFGARSGWRSSGHHGRCVRVARFMHDRMGASHRQLDDRTIDRVLSGLDDPRDDEHPDVAIEQESGWSLSAFQQTCSCGRTSRRLGSRAT